MGAQGGVGTPGITVDDALSGHGYALWPADALPAELGVAAAQARLRAAGTRRDGEGARLVEEAVIAASAGLRAAAPADRAAARIAIGMGVERLRVLAEAGAEPEAPSGDAVDVFTATLQRATWLRDRGDCAAARERLGEALALGGRIDAGAGGSFSFAEQAAAALRVHDAVWAPAHEIARSLPARAVGFRAGHGLAGL